MANNINLTVSIINIVGEKKYADLKGLLRKAAIAKYNAKMAKYQKAAAKSSVKEEQSIAVKRAVRITKKLVDNGIKAAVLAKINGQLEINANAKATAKAEAMALEALVELKIDKDLLARNSAENGVNEASRDVIHAKMQEKETLTITKVSVVSRYATFGKAVDLLTREEKLLYKNRYVLGEIVKAVGRNAVITTIDTLAKAEWLRKVTNEFAGVTNTIVYSNTDSGYAPVMAKDYYDDLLLVDFGSSYSKEQETLIQKVSKRGIIIRIKTANDLKYRYFFKHENGFWIDLGMYLDNEDSKANGQFNIIHGRVFSEEYIQAAIQDKRIVEYDKFVFFNASPSSTRSSSGIFIKVPKDCEDIWKWLREMYSIATNGLIDEMEIDWADGEEYQKAIKDISRLTLAMTDAREYRDVVRGFCMVNAKFVVKDAADKTGKSLVEAFDGAFLAHTNLYIRMFEQYFGHKPSNKQIRQFHGDCAQMRIACQLKGMAQFFNEKCFEMALNNILHGGLTNKQECRVLLFHDKETVQKKKHLIKKNDMIFSGPAFADIKTDAAGYIVKKPEKIAELFKRTDVVGDMNAYKYLRVITEAQSVNLMAFPPALEKNSRMSLSNQGLTSILWNKKEEDGTFTHQGGKDLIIDIFKENLARLFKHDEAKLAIEQFSNFDSYPDSGISAINLDAYLLDQYSRFTVMSQLTEKANNMINGFNFEIDGFNAIGLIDPALWLTGKRSLYANEMFSGNVKKEKKRATAVIRHPRICRFSLSMLYDLNVKVIRKRLHNDAALGIYSEEEADAILSVFYGIYGRVSVMPTFDSRFPNLHDGSDSDGDSFGNITHKGIIAILMKMVPMAIDYGKAPKVDEKVVLDIRHMSKGVMNSLRAFYEYFNTGNLDIGVMARFNSTIIGLLDQIENGLMTQQDAKEFFSVLELIGNGEENAVFLMDNPDYESFFVPDNKGTILANAKRINEWLQYCKTRKTRSLCGLHALLTDISIANSSIMGRIIDAAKTGEKVYAAFVNTFRRVKCAYGKNHVGITDIKICYHAQSVANGQILVEDKFYVSDYVQKGLVDANNDERVYVVNDISRQIKNECADIFVEEANKYLDQLNQKAAELAGTKTAQLLSQSWILSKGSEGAREIGRIYSGIVNNRKDASQDIIPYIANSLRRYAENSCDYSDRLKLALAACSKDPKEKKDEDQLSIDRTRGYKALGAELGILSVCDKVSDATELNAEDRVYTSGRQLLKHGTVLNFVNGLAKLEDGYAICKKTDGAYKVVINDDGKAYASMDIAEFLKAKSAINNKFVINMICPTKGLAPEEKNAALKAGIKSLVTIYNSEDIKREWSLISKVIQRGKFFYIFLVAVKNNIEEDGTRKFKVVGRIHTENSENIIWNKQTRKFNDTQFNILNGKQWDIDNVLTYVNSSNELYSAVCLSQKDVIDPAIFRIPAENIMKVYDGQ